ncbi:tectonin beta-propeller repeat-containing protein 2 [Morone saxatilis]|uniref:tectonin beta-propeller repeat-containing protein 2 n=1 Tax=Morone saxatilis TaxID=34816 RepID=UPI0015E1BFC3|nr:tectonin beta-propeller repeat-containing protein 2 [Morone saxatilis]
MAAQPTPPSVLREFCPLYYLLNAIPAKVQRGFRSVLVYLTALDSSSDFLAVGSSIGMLYLYCRRLAHMNKYSLEGKSDAITAVKLLSCFDDLVAVGTASGRVAVFQLVSPLPGRNKQLRRFDVVGLHKGSVTSLAWSTNGMKLFSGDDKGRVVFSSLDLDQGVCKPVLLLEESSGVVQMEYSHQVLLVSTQQRSLLYCTQKQEVQQLGTKPRKSSGRFGACFLPGLCKQSDLQVFAARPGLRLWRSDIRGQVEETRLLKPLFNTQIPQFELFPRPGPIGAYRPAERQLGLLSCFLREGWILSWNEYSLYVLDCINEVIIGALESSGDIVSVSCCDNEIFILKGDRDIIRLSNSPEGLASNYSSSGTRLSGGAGWLRLTCCSPDSSCSDGGSGTPLVPPALQGSLGSFKGLAEPAEPGERPLGLPGGRGGRGCPPDPDCLDRNTPVWFQGGWKRGGSLLSHWPCAAGGKSSTCASNQDGGGNKTEQSDQTLSGLPPLPPPSLPPGPPTLGYTKPEEVWHESLDGISGPGWFVWCLDFKGGLFCSTLPETGLTWQRFEDNVHQVALSPSGNLLWKVEQKSMTAFACAKVSVKGKRHWYKAVEQTAFVALSDDSAWIIRTNGDLYLQTGLSVDRPCARSVKVDSPCVFSQVCVRGGVVWALSEHKALFYREGLNSYCSEGEGWKYDTVSLQFLSCCLCLVPAGTFWQNVVPRGTVSATRWTFITSSAVPHREGTFLWLAQSRKDLFCVWDQDGELRPSSVPLPPEVELTHLSACRDALWGLDTHSRVSIRTLSPSCPAGLHWTPLDLSQLGTYLSHTLPYINIADFNQRDIQAEQATKTCRLCDEDDNDEVVVLSSKDACITSTVNPWRLESRGGDGGGGVGQSLSLSLPLSPSPVTSEDELWAVTPIGGLSRRLTKLLPQAPCRPAPSGPSLSGDDVDDEWELI